MTFEIQYWATKRQLIEEVKQTSAVKIDLTSYGGFWHHGGNVLGPVERYWTSHLDIWGVTSCCERHNWGVMDNLLRLHLIGHVPLETKEKYKEQQGWWRRNLSRGPVHFTSPSVPCCYRGEDVFPFLIEIQYSKSLFLTHRPIHNKHFAITKQEKLY